MATQFHEELRLYVTHDRFIFEPLDSGVEKLVIDRVSQDIFIQTSVDIPLDVGGRLICGILGVVHLLAGPYLVVITKKAKCGDINGHAIYRIEETDILSYKRTFLHITEKQNQDNRTYLTMIQTVLQMPYFYFSYTYDLTHTMQRLHNTSPEFRQMSLFERADPRFVWNSHLLRDFAAQSELSQFTLPVILGFVSIKTVVINKKTFTLALMTRRSIYRAGTRYYMRGVDSEGQVANFCESEQIVVYSGDICSFVQTRGSIPLYWSQRPNLRYKPLPKVDLSQPNADSYNRHMDAQVVNYGRQVLLDLIDQKPPEKHLGVIFQGAVQQISSGFIKYEPFDFHHECSKMRWDRLSILMDRIAKDQKDFGYFMISRNGLGMEMQEGVFRTNCIDCLDRTNVVQSLIARRCLQEQLTRLGILVQGQSLDNQEMFEYIYRNIWADNADCCSVQYAGTGALKTDFTRTGKRTIWGLFQDGWNAAIRYFINNFSDGFRQDAIDVFLGNYIVEESTNSPFQDTKDWRIFVIPLIFIVAFSMLFISLIIPSDDIREQFVYILFWGGASIGTLFFIFLFGTEYVDKPKLTQAKQKME